MYIFLFFVCFKKFDQVARKCLGVAMYTLGRADGCDPLRRGRLLRVARPWALLRGAAAGLPTRTAARGWDPRRPGRGRQARSYRSRVRLAAGVTAALISSPSGS